MMRAEALALTALTIQTVVAENTVVVPGGLLEITVLLSVLAVEVLYGPVVEAVVVVASVPQISLKAGGGGACHKITPQGERSMAGLHSVAQEALVLRVRMIMVVLVEAVEADVS